MPPEAFNRIADNWRPLFAIAEVAGGDWPQRAAKAFEQLTTREDVDTQGIGAMLLNDIRQAFTDEDADRMFSKEIIHRLCDMTDRPWNEAHRGGEINENWLSRKLRGFKIAPKTLRIDGDRKKGYELADFTDAFERYLPAPGDSNRDTRDKAIDTGISPASQAVTTEEAVTDSKPQETVADIDLSRRHGSEAQAISNDTTEWAIL